MCVPGRINDGFMGQNRIGLAWKGPYGQEDGDANHFDAQSILESHDSSNHFQSLETIQTRK
jgi:hypothetical protein